MSRLDILKANAESIIGDEDMMERIRAGKKLKIKLGVDPTRPDLTFGHMVVFNKMKQFQAMGHECILLIGDYTATIGDPSGRSETRPVLTDEEVANNAETYLDQAFQILDSNLTTVRYNSEWYMYDDAVVQQMEPSSPDAVSSRIPEPRTWIRKYSLWR